MTPNEEKTQREVDMFFEWLEGYVDGRSREFTQHNVFKIDERITWLMEIWRGRERLEAGLP